MWQTSDISVGAADDASNAIAERVMQRVRARRLPVERGLAGRYLVVCCRSFEPLFFRRLHNWSTTSADRIIVVTEDEPTAADSWQALRHGASDVVQLGDVDGVADKLERWIAIDELLVSGTVTSTLVGESPGWVKVVRELVDLARFSSINLLIGGESGTGKELAARLVHTLDPRPTKGALVTVDCTTIIPTLAGSELFGHERGAFTGAERSREGAFARAHGGTLFLDEIAELSLPLQAELLRVVQDGNYKPVGSNVWCEAKFRLVCATHRDLLAAVAAGTFRQDLYFRIAGTMIRLPPLRDRREDISRLATHFLAQLEPDCVGFDPLLTAYLESRPWPGNVRELRHYVHRLAARHCGNGPVTIGAVPREDQTAPAIQPVPRVRERARAALAAPGAVRADASSLERAVRALLRQGLRLPEIAQRFGDIAVDLTLKDESGNVHRAAVRLGVTDRALQQRRQRRPAARSPVAARALSIVPRQHSVMTFNRGAHYTLSPESSTKSSYMFRRVSIFDARADASSQREGALSNSAPAPVSDPGR